MSDLSVPASKELSGLSIDRSSPLPAYAQIKDQLASVISKFRSRGIEAFYTDEVLSTHFGVSRMTMRHAISDLVRDGILYRRKGVGTFIAEPKAVETEGPIGDFFDDWLSQGHLVRVRVPEFKKLSPPDDVMAKLRIAGPSKILFFRRLRLLDDTPIAVDDRWVGPAASNAISKSDLLRKSIHLIVEPALGVRVGRADVEIEAGRCPALHAGHLRIDVDEPVLIRTITSISTEGHPLWTGRSLYRADLYKYKASVAAP